MKGLTLREHLARIRGIRTEKRAAASRENGKKGGPSKWKTKPVENKDKKPLDKLLQQVDDGNHESRDQL